MNKIITLSLIVFLTSYTYSAANEQSEKTDEVIVATGVRAGDIYAACKNYFIHTFNTRENTARKATCNGYFFGIGTTLLTLQESGNYTDSCLPTDISTHKIIEIFLSWAGRQSSDLNALATESVINSVNEVYPCP